MDEFTIAAVFCRSVTIELNSDTCWRPRESVSVTLEELPGSGRGGESGVSRDLQESGDYRKRGDLPENGDDLQGTGRFGTRYSIQKDVNTNVFSLYHLEPDREYRVCIGGEEKRFRTKAESALLDVRRFGAAGDGKQEDTAFLQAAVLSCPENGTVYVPAGTYLTGPLFLKSRMTLWLDEGAELRGLAEQDRYPVLPGVTRSSDERREYNLGTWEGNPLDSFASLITAVGCRDVDIIGTGTLNGQGKEGGWWENPKLKKRVRPCRDEDAASDEEKPGRSAWRPNTLHLNHCSHVRVQGITVCNSPSWTVHPYYSDHLQFLNLNIENPYHSPNTDGWDPESCQDVLLLGTRIAVGDDCIAIKSGKIYMAREHFRRTSEIEIRNCLLEHGHGSVTIGSEISAGVENVHVTKCIFHETDRGIRIKSRRGRGDTSVLDGLRFDNIRMEDVRMPVTVNMFYYCDPDGHSAYVQEKKALPVDDRTPRIGMISIRNVTCTGAHASVIAAYGLPEQPIGGIDVENLDASFAPAAEREPEQAVMADGVPALNGRSVVVRNAETVRLSSVTFRGAEDEKPDIEGVEQAQLRDVHYNG